MLRNNPGEKMIKRLNEAFSETNHKLLHEKKEELRKKYNLPKLSWHDYILHISKIELLKKNSRGNLK